MGIKKIARPINKDKNKFIEWLKRKDADNVNQYDGIANGNWHYYRAVSGFIGSYSVRAYFYIHKTDDKKAIEHNKIGRDVKVSSVEELIKSIEKELKELED